MFVVIANMDNKWEIPITLMCIASKISWNLCMVIFIPCPTNLWKYFVFIKNCSRRALYFISFIENCLRRIWVDFIKRKDKVFGTFSSFHAFVTIQTRRKLKCDTSRKWGWVHKYWEDFVSCKWYKKGGYNTT